MQDFWHSKATRIKKRNKRGKFEWSKTMVSINLLIFFCHVSTTIAAPTSEMRRLANEINDKIDESFVPTSSGWDVCEEDLNQYLDAHRGAIETKDETEFSRRFDFNQLRKTVSIAMDLWDEGYVVKSSSLFEKLIAMADAQRKDENDSQYEDIENFDESDDEGDVKNVAPPDPNSCKNKYQETTITNLIKFLQVTPKYAQNTVYEAVENLKNSGGYASRHLNTKYMKDKLEEIQELEDDYEITLNDLVGCLTELLPEGKFVWKEASREHIFTEIRKRTFNSPQLIYQTLINAKGSSSSETDIKRMQWFSRIQDEVTRIQYPDDSDMIVDRVILLKEMFVQAEKIVKTGAAELQNTRDAVFLEGRSEKYPPFIMDKYRYVPFRPGFRNQNVHVYKCPLKKRGNDRGTTHCGVEISVKIDDDGAIVKNANGQITLLTDHIGQHTHLPSTETQDTCSNLKGSFKDKWDSMEFPYEEKERQDFNKLTEMYLDIDPNDNTPLQQFIEQHGQILWADPDNQKLNYAMVYFLMKTCRGENGRSMADASFYVGYSKKTRYDSTQTNRYNDHFKFWTLRAQFNYLNENDHITSEYKAPLILNSWFNGESLYAYPALFFKTKEAAQDAEALIIFSLDSVTTMTNIVLPKCKICEQLNWTNKQKFEAGSGLVSLASKLFLENDARCIEKLPPSWAF